MHYLATFKGRRRNAIGKRYEVTAGAVGNNEDEARISLYENWEHITGLVLAPLDPEQQGKDLKDEIRG